VSKHAFETPSGYLTETGSLPRRAFSFERLWVAAAVSLMCFLVRATPTEASEQVETPAAPLASTASTGAVSKPAPGGTSLCDAAIPTVMPAASMKFSVTVKRESRWRPTGAEVRLTLKGQGVTLNGLMIVTCFARRPLDGDPEVFKSSGPIKIYSWQADAIEFGAAVPDIGPSNGGVWQRYVVNRFRSLATYSAVVPITDLRVVATGGPVDGAPVDLIVPIGVTSVPAALITVALLVGLAFLILRRFVINRLAGGGNVILTIISTSKGYASLSQFQVMVWTLVVGASAIYVMVLSGNLIDIPDQMLILLGITGVAIIGVRLQGANQAGGVPAPAAVVVNPIPPQAQGASAVAAPTDSALPRIPRWSDLVMSTSEGSEVDVTRVQMFFFTLVSAFFVLLNVFSSYSLPELPTGFLLLMGVSNGVYITSKFVPAQQVAH
jgi:hypothetical protein